MGSGLRPMWDRKGYEVARAGKRHFSIANSDDEPLRVVSEPVYRRGEINAVVQVAYPLTEIENAIAGMDQALLTLIPVGLLCAWLGGSFLTNRVLRRVRITTQAAGAMSATDFSARLPIWASAGQRRKARKQTTRISAH